MLGSSRNGTTPTADLQSQSCPVHRAGAASIPSDAHALGRGQDGGQVAVALTPWGSVASGSFGFPPS